MKQLLLGTGSLAATDPKDHSIDLLGHSDRHPDCNYNNCECCNRTLLVRLWRHSRSQNPDLDINRRSWSTRLQGDLHTKWYRYTNEEVVPAVKSEAFASVCGTAKVLHFRGSIQWVFDGLQRRTHVTLSHIHYYRWREGNTKKWCARTHTQLVPSRPFTLLSVY